MLLLDVFFWMLSIRCLLIRCLLIEALYWMFPVCSFLLNAFYQMLSIRCLLMTFICLPECRCFWQCKFSIPIWYTNCMVTIRSKTSWTKMSSAILRHPDRCYLSFLSEPYSFHNSGMRMFQLEHPILMPLDPKMHLKFRFLMVPPLGSIIMPNYRRQFCRFVAFINMAMIHRELSITTQKSKFQIIFKSKSY